MNPITSETKVDRQTSTAPNGDTYCWLNKTRTVYRQKKPYNLNLPYSMRHAVTLSYQLGYASSAFYDAESGSSTAGIYAYDIISGHPNNTNFAEANRLVADVTQKARERFVGSMKGNAGLGVDLVEGKQALSMIENRAMQVFRFARMLHRGRIQDAAKILGVSNHPSYHKLAKNLSVRGQLRKARFKRDLRLKQKASKAFLTEDDKMYSDLFLEFHFGWSPLVSDIYDSMDVLQREIPAGRIIGRAKAQSEMIVTAGSGSWSEIGNHALNVDVVVGATVSVSNPNLALANQLGVINPATLVWEVIPFSFVVDWFVNVSDFLGSFTEFAGYTVTDPFTRVYTYDTCTYTVRDTAGIPYYGTSLAWTAKSVCASASRVLALPDVPLKVRAPWRLSPTRALTAISLLVQQGFGR